MAMSSSSDAGYIRRPEWVDLQTTEPQASEETFDENVSFELIDRAGARELVPEEAYRDGLAEGEQRGRESTLKELSPVLDEFRAIAKSMAIVREQRLLDAEAELVEVATEIARRILRAELQQRPEGVVELARECIAQAADEGVMRLRVAPADLELIRAHLAEVELDLAEGQVQVEADATLEAGSVVLHTTARVYDGRPERILGAARRHVEAMRRDP
jgi:flagellar biosynthesis/type III secretory pathway protein FliH